MTPLERFRAACASLPTDRPPVWLMRQAGRYMPEYRALRARHSLLDLCRSPALAAQVTIEATEILQTDAAIIFADLLLPAFPLGLQLDFLAGEGPKLSPPIRTSAQIASLPAPWPGALDFVSEAIARAVTHFRGDLPVLGFVGAPFTLASYLIEGGASRQFLATKELMWRDPSAFDALLATLTVGLAAFAREQAAAGAAAIQIFDSWAGALAPADYERFVLPHTRRLVAAIQTPNLPVIYFSTGTSGYIELTAQTRARVLSLDWRISIADAWARLERSEVPHPPALQGNLDPLLLLAPESQLLAAAEHLRAQVRGRPGFIFNLGHGILPETPVPAVQRLIEWVKSAAW